jgi:hypothetical protein
MGTKNYLTFPPWKMFLIVVRVGRGKAASPDLVWGLRNQPWHGWHVRNQSKILNKKIKVKMGCSFFVTLLSHSLFDYVVRSVAAASEVKDSVWGSDKNHGVVSAELLN